MLATSAVSVTLVESCSKTQASKTLDSALGDMTRSENCKFKGQGWRQKAEHARAVPCRAAGQRAAACDTGLAPDLTCWSTPASSPSRTYTSELSDRTTACRHVATSPLLGGVGHLRVVCQVPK